MHRSVMRYFRFGCVTTMVAYNRKYAFCVQYVSCSSSNISLIANWKDNVPMSIKIDTQEMTIFANIYQGSLLIEVGI